MRPQSAPFYFLYGEETRTIEPGFVHVERISRRRISHGGAVKPHSHPHLHQLSFWPKAEGRYTAETEVHDLTGPTLTWMPSNTIHGFTVTTESDSIVVSLSDDLVDQSLRRMAIPIIGAALRRPLVIPVEVAEAARLTDGFEQIEREYNYPSWAQSATIEAHVSLLFIALVRLAERREHTNSAMTAPGLFGRLLAALDANFSTMRTVDDYATLLNTTPYLLNRATMMATGAKASDVIRGRILQEAKRLLLFTAIDAAIVGFTIGFTDAAHFGRFFRRETGLTPLQWRKRRQALLMSGASTESTPSV